MARHIELNPATHLTIGTVGEPGKRVFYLQGSKGTELITLIIEKHQAAMLVSSFETLLDEIEEKHPDDTAKREDVWTDMRLREPIEALFRVSNLGLIYNEELDRVVLVAYELVPEGEEPNVVSYWASRTQIRSLTKHTLDVVRAGRPICGNCGQPMDAEGHFCPHRNGHRS